MQLGVLMFNKSINLAFVSAAACTALVLGTAPAAWAKEEGGAYVYNSGGTNLPGDGYHQPHNDVQTPGGNFIFQTNGHAGSSSDGTRDSNHGHLLYKSGDEHESHYSYSGPDGSGGTTSASSHKVDDEIQFDRYDAKGSKNRRR
jgi:hypothetical protein